MDQKCHFRLSFVWKFKGTIGNRDQSILSGYCGSLWQ